MRKTRYIILFSILSILWFTNVQSRLSIDSYMNWKYSIVDFSVFGLINFYLDLMPVFIVLFLYGNYIYKHFIFSAPYYMVRHVDRRKWLRKQEVELFKEILFYWLLFYSVFLICTVFYLGLSSKIILGLLTQLVLDVMFSYAFCLFMNILSIKIGSQYSFIITYSMIIISVGVINFHESLLLVESLVGYTLFLINPLSNLVLNFHFKNSGGINFISVGEMIPVVYSVFYYSVISAMIMQIGKLVVVNHNMLPKEGR